MNRNDGLHIQIIAFALLTSVLTALANLLVENWFGINVFSFGLWFILPVGAVIVGMGGASGGFLACKYFNIKPNWLDALALAVIAAFTMYLIYYLGYITLLLEDGSKASDLVDFGTYLDVIVTKSHMRIGRALQNDTGEVGNFGYLLLAIKFVGVLLGGFAIFANLKSLAMCEKCGVYYKKIASKETSHATTNDAQAVYEKMNSGSIDDYKEALQTTAKGDCEAKIKFTLMRCPKCKDEYISEEFFVKGKDKNFVAVAGLTGKTNIPKDSDFQPLFQK
ncbi:hypothetical protein [Polynucleobacter sp. AP-RePozz3-80-G7]|uniref:hypothetical protein n=1 Tax=Polynucleobacter sp. AP-RePozz3-80-G7 TaxID=2689105 RepID=UPI001C0BFBF4|nr:hypothetical protein [Polynucleobacter sp. AP-RePozz3-80-G7]MBU3638193.1 hypothetical protein [Polynucleobacter sp. AP-RePozz3-80-G7]